MPNIFTARFFGFDQSPHTTTLKPQTNQLKMKLGSSTASLWSFAFCDFLWVNHLNHLLLRRSFDYFTFSIRSSNKFEDFCGWSMGFKNHTGVYSCILLSFFEHGN